MTVKRALTAITVVLLATVAMPRIGRAQGVAEVLTAKSLPPATVALIDPESGTSAGGGSSDVKIAVGDIVLFRFRHAAAPDATMRGINGYLTEFVPRNTRVVGVRITDANGVTIPPRHPGLTFDGWGPGNPGSYAVDCGAAGCTLAGGSLAQVYADTGVFYSNDPALARNPDIEFLKLGNGIELGTKEPAYGNVIQLLLGLANPLPNVWVHTTWDKDQVKAFGVVTGNGNTPHGYGSPVAGSGAHYRFAPVWNGTQGVYEFTDADGPWTRTVYPGALRGWGNAPPDDGVNPDILARMVVPETGGDYVNPAHPRLATAVRYALGALRVGEEAYAEVALIVDALPLDGVAGNVDCAETVGGDVTKTEGGSNSNGKYNPWLKFVPSPACVYLNLLFDIEADKALLSGNETVWESVRAKNLSLNNDTNVCVRMGSSSGNFPVLPAGASLTRPAACSAYQACPHATCLWWVVGTMTPSQEWPATDTKMNVTFDPSGSDGSATVFADYFSSRVPLGFTTKSMTYLRSVGVPQLTLNADNTPGDGIVLNGSVTNAGSDTFSFQRFVLWLPTGWSITAWNTSTLSGCAVLPPPPHTPAFTWNRWQCSFVDVAFAKGETQPLQFTLNTGGAPEGLYPIHGQIWAGGGEQFDTFFADVVVQPTVKPRTDPPVVGTPALPPVVGDTCNIVSTTGGIVGTSEPGAFIKLYLNGVFYPGATATADGSGNWYIPATAYAATFGQLYGGAEIRATATLVGTKLESPLSIVACFPRPTKRCNDGLDNDGDGLTDFPSDPGCESPIDDSEAPDNANRPPDDECVDGVDNDGDGLTDMADPDCQCPAVSGAGVLGRRKVERPGAAIPACHNGCDDDNDGRIDFGGLDLNLDGVIDVPADPGCHSANDSDEADVQDPPNVISPRLLLLFDTSGSMNWNTCGDFTFMNGDGSAECLGNDLVCNSPTCAPSGCGNTYADDTRVWKVKDGVASAVTAFGEVEWGLMRFHQRPERFGVTGGVGCPTDNASLRAGGWQGSFLPPCGGGFSAADLLVTFSSDNTYDLLQWMDNSSNWTQWGAGTNTYPVPPGFDFELRGTGTTPLAGSLSSALTYLQGIKAADPQWDCRPYRVILVTDGAETCSLNPTAPVDAAAALLANEFPTYVIGFATPVTAIMDQLDDIAEAGRVGGKAIFADDSVSLSTAIATIVNDSIKVELCNGRDDDCDGLTDEGFPVGASCNNGKLGICSCVGAYACQADYLDVECIYPTTPPPDTCQLQGAEVCCNGLDDDCDGQVDEPPCRCGTEVCNGLDDNSNGQTDEPPLPGVGETCGYSVGECNPGLTSCIAGRIECDFTGVIHPFPVDEACNCLDDNCNGTTDEGVARECYTCSSGVAGVGDCRGGIQVCDPSGCPTVGWTNPSCGGQICPIAEACDGRDNDCDGFTDEDLAGNALAERCYTGTSGCNWQTGECAGECAWGTRTCANGVWGACAGEVRPVAETCNGKDDDCDGTTDGVNSVILTQACYSGAVETNGVGICHGGTQTCQPASGTWGTCEGEQLPVVPEVCNGQDDDCNGLVDDGVTRPCYTGPSGTLGVGVCHGGTETCSDGAWGTCTGQQTPLPELCDDADNDCDGTTDGFTENCYPGGPECNVITGVCVGRCRVGTRTCVAGTGYTACQNAQLPVDETCNGLDDDCNGFVDDDVTRSCYTGPSGTLGNGICHGGTETCSNGAWGTCSGQQLPLPEVCDNVDNDCDGTTDGFNENCYTGGGECNVTTGVCVGRCRVGTRTCVAVTGYTACQNERKPTGETCNGLDDDCDGTIDGVSGVPITRPCYSGPAGTQNVGECRGGTATCTNASWGECAGQTLPTTEVCDGKDNNCNGSTDENTSQLCYDDPQEGCNQVTRVCLGVCALGTRACVNGAPSPTCDNQVRRTPEECNNLDDDCDGTTDMQSRPCYTGPSGTEGVGPCHGGNQQCVAGNWQSCGGQVVPVVEDCDGVDNNCNGSTDEGLQNVYCYPNGETGCNLITGVCTGVCNFGRTSCTNGSWDNPACQGAKIPTPEVCNGLDDNCNGSIDEGLTESYYTGPNGTVNVGECRAGVRECNIGNWDVLQPQVIPQPEDCNGKDDDCDGLTDEDELGNPLSENCYNFGLGGCDALTGVCKGVCAYGVRTCGGGQWGACVNEINPTPEICDNLDNDCDGQVDEELTQPYYTGPDETRSVGECRDGLETCSLGVWYADGNQVLPTPEVCDNKDNDCNGLTDDGLVGVKCYDGGAECDLLTGACKGICQIGTKACTAGVWSACDGQVLPSAEECNCFDDDCDGEVDNPPAGQELPGVGEACDVGICAGIRVCDVHLCTLRCSPTAGAGVEICDGIDNDCDNLIDEDPETLCDKEDPADPTRLCAGPLTSCEPADTNGFGYVCSPGHYMCTNGAIECVDAVLPQPELCDGIDNDCDGVVDDGDLCSAGSVCYQGECVEPCQNDEFPCSGGRTCVDGGDLDARLPCANPGVDACYCLSSACVGVTCDAGWICREQDGACHDLCENVTCEAPRRCHFGQCLDCTVLGCPAGQLCAGQTCIDDPCASVQCAADEICSQGECVSSCTSVQCPYGQVCRAGECVGDLCAGVLCRSDQFCKPETGECTASPCISQNCAPGALCSDQTGACLPDPCLLTTCGQCTECQADTYYMTASCVWQEGCGEVKIYAAGGCAVAGDGINGWRALPLLLLLALGFVRRRRVGGGGQ